MIYIIQCFDCSHYTFGNLPCLQTVNFNYLLITLLISLLAENEETSMEDKHCCHIWYDYEHCTHGRMLYLYPFEWFIFLFTCILTCNLTPGNFQFLLCGALLLTISPFGEFPSIIREIPFSQTSLHSCVLTGIVRGIPLLWLFSW